MKHYEIIYSNDAKEDINNLFEFIIFQYKAPITAFRYVQGLLDEIKELSFSAQSYAVQTRKSIIQYGANARRVNYKRMTIIYTVHGSVVFIHRIVASSLISDL